MQKGIYEFENETISLLDLNPTHEMVFRKQEKKDRGFINKEIKSPAHMSFDIENYFEVVNPFTEGAIKNMVCISRQYIRLYKITTSSIELISRSELPAATSDLIFGFKYKQGSSVLSDPVHSSIQIIAGELNKATIIRFHRETGSLQTIENKDFEEETSRNLSKTQKFDLEPPKNSQSDHYLFYEEKETVQNIRKIGKVRKGKLKLWIDLREISKEIRQESISTPSSLAIHKIFEETPIRFEIDHQSRLLAFRGNSGRKNHIAVCTVSSFSLGIDLIDLGTRKRVASRSLTLGDLITSSKIIEDLLLEVVCSEQQGVEEGRVSDFYVELNGCYFEAKNKSLLLLIRAKDHEIRVRIDEVLESEQLKITNVSMVTLPPSEHNSSKWTHLVSLTDRKIGKIGDRLQRSRRAGKSYPFTLLDYVTLEEAHLKGLEECEEYLVMKQSSKPELFKLNYLRDFRVLMTSSLSSIIYDLKREKVITGLRHALHDSSKGRSFLVKGGDLLIWSSSNFFQILKMSKKPSGDQECIENIKEYRLEELFEYKIRENPNDRFNILQLENGNYLFIDSKLFNSLAPTVENNINDQEEEEMFIAEIVLEIDKNSLETLRKKMIRFKEEIKYQLTSHTVSLIQDYLIFNTNVSKKTKKAMKMMRRPGFPAIQGTELVLADQSFQVLTFCPLTKLRAGDAIQTISGDRVISEGKDMLYLHKLEEKGEGPRVILHKKLRIEGGRRSAGIMSFISELGYSVLFRFKDQAKSKKIFLLVFDMDLCLTKCLDFSQSTNFPCMGSFLIGGGKLAVTMNSGAGFKNEVYVIDPEEKRVKLAQNLKERGDFPKYSFDKKARRFYSAGLVGESIEKVYLS